MGLRIVGLKTLGSIGRAALGLGVAASLSGPALAQGKVWRHGIIEAKSDSGIFFMPSKRGFADKLGLDLQTVQLKTDSIGLKALLAGELDSFEGGVTPIGIFRHAPRETGAESLAADLLSAQASFGPKDLSALLHAADTWSVGA